MISLYLLAAVSYRFVMDLALGFSLLISWGFFAWRQSRRTA